jgi:CRP/FNR family transcriptional regulator
MKTADLAKFPIFSGLTPQEIGKIAAISEEVSFPDGEAIFREGDRSAFLYLILSGRISLRMSLPNQKSLAIGTLEPGEELGWSAVRRSKPYTATAVAIGTVEVVRIAAEGLAKVFESDPRIGYYTCRGLLGIVAERLEEARLRIANMQTG